MPALGGRVTDSKRVLVVDDEESIRTVVAEALELDGYQVSTATNGAEALQHVRAHRPDAVVLDLMMPVMDGWQFMDAFRRDPVIGRTPVVVMSAYRGLAATAPELGASACIAKPFDLDVLLGAVDRLVRRAA
jgi:two-component system chemotaxis response regulator CheY